MPCVTQLTLCNDLDCGTSVLRVLFEASANTPGVLTLGMPDGGAENEG
jgi:hypothetical protein